jgi:D-alanyl-D-alanine carboxypeptidase
MKNKGIQSFILLLVLTLLVTCCTRSANEPVHVETTPSASQEVEELARDVIAYIEPWVSNDEFSGVVLIAKDGVPILKEAYGLANRSFDVPNRVDTKFNLGSMNKMFTAVAILQLAEKGRLSVEDRIIDHVPDYPNEEVAKRVTIHHLLTHTSGLGDIFTHEFYETSSDRFRDVEDYLPLFVDAPLRFEPGAQFSYSNAGFMVLGLIIEKVTGQSYFDYVMENIYQPSGMINTDAYELDYAVPNLAVGYTKQGARFKNNYYTNLVKGSPAGGGYSTVEDLLNFSKALLSHKLLSPEWTEMLFEGKVDVDSTSRHAKYAYGFLDIKVNDHRVVGHGGGAPGVCSNLDIYLDVGYTVVVLSNSDGCFPIYGFIRDKLLGRL